MTEQEHPQLKNHEGPPSVHSIRAAGVLISGIGLTALTGAGLIYNPEVTKTAIAAVAFGASAVAIAGITALRR